MPIVTNPNLTDTGVSILGIKVFIHAHASTGLVYLRDEEDGSIHSSTLNLATIENYLGEVMRGMDISYNPPREVTQIWVHRWDALALVRIYADLSPSEDSVLFGDLIAQTCAEAFYA